MVIGSAWKKTSQGGKQYLSCVIQSPFFPDGEIRFAIFAVDEKKSDNAPDYNLVWNKQKPKSGDSGTAGDEEIPF